MSMSMSMSIGFVYLSKSATTAYHLIRSLLSRVRLLAIRLDHPSTLSTMTCMMMMMINLDTNSKDKYSPK